jgi:pilus assembly protein TadC
MDIRIPVSLLFAVLGALLAGFGLATASSPIYARHSLGINLNLWAGLGMLVFAGALFRLARRAAVRQRAGHDVMERAGAVDRDARVG